MNTHRHKVRQLYQKYKKHCSAKGTTPVPFKQFQDQVDTTLGRLLSQKIAGLVPEEDVIHAHYIASRVTVFNGIPPVGSVTRQCEQCQADVFVDVTMLKTAERSKGIICTTCAPEVFGKPADQLIAEQLKKAGL